MAADLTSRRFHLRIVTGGITAAAATYDSENYGSADVTYGQEAGESTFLGFNYHVLPVGGWHPSQPAWKFRKGDTVKPFGAIVVNGDDPAERIDLDAIASAQLRITQIGFGIASPNVQTFDLTLNTTDDVFERTWGASDLSTPGTYALSLKITYNTGRVLTLEAENILQMKVGDGP